MSPVSALLLPFQTDPDQRLNGALGMQERIDGKQDIKGEIDRSYLGHLLMFTIAHVSYTSIELSPAT